MYNNNYAQRRDDCTKQGAKLQVRGKGRAGGEGSGRGEIQNTISNSHPEHYSKYYTVEIGYLKLRGGLYFSMIQYHNGTRSENQYLKRY